MPPVTAGYYSVDNINDEPQEEFSETLKNEKKYNSSSQNTAKREEKQLYEFIIEHYDVDFSSDKNGKPINWVDAIELYPMYEDYCKRFIF